jgi:hypothetical protein
MSAAQRLPMLTNPLLCCTGRISGHGYAKPHKEICRKDQSRFWYETGNQGCAKSHANKITFRNSKAGRPAAHPHVSFGYR